MKTFIQSCRTIIGCLLLVANGLPLCAQSEEKAPQALSPQTDSLAHFVRNIVTYNSMFKQEKVYLHFDNTGYFMGETIWFKGYVVNPMSNRPNILSRVLYVELLTPEGRVLQSHKLKIENGQCSGQLSLKDLLHPGFYEVRAYTAVMLNWPDAPIFSRVFPIFHAPQTEGTDMYKDPFMTPIPQSERQPEMRAKQPKAEKINVQFFPEGGNLVQGVANQVAFKVTDKRGNSANINGTIYNSRREKVATTQTIHQGMGRFTLTPAEGESYLMEITDEKGKVHPFNLPIAEAKGYAMTVNNMHPQQLEINLAHNGRMDTTRALGLTVMCRGRVIQFEQIKWNGNSTTTLTIAKENLPEGINQLTLFDTEGRIYADRLFFIPPTHSIQFALNGKKAAYQPREMVEMNFKLTDNEGNPVRTMFSLAVRDADTDTPSNDANGGGSIAANLLLGSELKGYIHNLDYYLEADDEPHRLALDLLLCTQGWRRYDWEKMTHPNDFVVNYPAEEGILIRGNLTSSFRKRTKEGADIKVFLYNGAGRSLKGSCLSDSIGQFAFLSEDFNGRWIMNIQTYEDDKLKEMNVNLNKTPSPQGRPLADKEKELFLAKENDTKEFVEAEDSMKMYDEKGRVRWENLLPTVEVEEDREWRSELVRKWHNMIYEMEDERMRMDETGENYLVEFYRWLEQTNPYFQFDIDTSKLTARYKGRPVRFFISRVGTDSWLVEQDVSINVEDLTIHDVEAIAISDKPNVEMALARYGLDSVNHQGNTVIVSLFVRNDYFRHKEYKGVRRTKIQGFTPSLQFYQPDYSYADLPDERDFRRTLYWAPYVVTDTQGEAKVSFYNSPNCKRIKVSAETITFGGVMGSFKE